MERRGKRPEVQSGTKRGEKKKGGLNYSREKKKNSH